MEGKFARPTREPSQRKATGTRAPRGAGGELQKRILAIVGQFPDGASAEVINSELQATDADAKKPIAAALFRMKKSNVLLQLKPRGPHTPPSVSFSRLRVEQLPRQRPGLFFATTARQSAMQSPPQYQ